MFFEKSFCKKFLRKKNIIFISLFFLEVLTFESFLLAEQLTSFLGPSVDKHTIWVGNKRVLATIPILIMAGHADSQEMEGEGTSGKAVGLKGLPPMDNTMSDELFWNLKIRDAVVKLGKEKNLIIDSYDPGIRTILNENDYKTNWSAGSRYASQGGYVLEIHFDSYGNDGLGSGLIPALSKNLNNIDESLARTFGRYPLFFRGGLGAPRRQIRILEIGKLEGELEKNLRDKDSRQSTINHIAHMIIDAITIGLDQKNSFNPLLQEGDIFLPGSNQ